MAVVRVSCHTADGAAPRVFRLAPTDTAQTLADVAAAAGLVRPGAGIRVLRLSQNARPQKLQPSASLASFDNGPPGPFSLTCAVARQPTHSLTRAVLQ